MSIVNRRNALLGWTVWQFAKSMARRKAKQAVPGVDTEKKRPNKPAMAAALLGAGAAFMFWRKRASSNHAPEPPV